MGQEPMTACLQADPARPLPSQDCCAAARREELFDSSAVFSCQREAALELNLAGQRDLPPPSATQEGHRASRFQIEPRKRTVVKAVAHPVEIRSSAFGEVMNFLEGENLDMRIRPLQAVHDRVWVNRELIGEFVLVGVPALPKFAPHRSRRSSECGGAHISGGLPQNRRKSPHPDSEGSYRAKSEKLNRVKVHDGNFDTIDCR